MSRRLESILLRFDAFQRSWIGLAGGLYLVQATALITGPIIARSIGAEARGFLALSLVINELTTRVANLGVPQAVGFLSDGKRGPSQIMGAATRISYFSIGPMLLAGIGIALYAQVEQPWSAALVLGGLVAASPLQMLALSHRHVLLGRGDLVGIRYYGAINQLVVIGVVLVGWTLGGISLPMAMSASLIASVIEFAMAYKRSGLRPQPGGRIRPLLNYGIRAMPGSLGTLLMFRVDQVFVASMLGLESLGVYAVAVSVSNVPLQATNALGYWAYGVSKAGKDRGSVRKVADRTWTVSGILLLGMIFLGPLVVGLYGSEFQGALQIFLILIPGTIALGAANILSQSLQARGKPGIASLAQLISGLAGLSVIPMILWLGLSGAALASSGSYILRLALIVIWFQRSDQSVLPTMSSMREILKLGPKDKRSKLPNDG